MARCRVPDHPMSTDDFSASVYSGGNDAVYGDPMEQEKGSMNKNMVVGCILVATLLIAPSVPEKEQPCQVLTATGGRVILRCPEKQALQADDRVYLRSVRHKVEEGC